MLVYKLVGVGILLLCGAVYPRLAARDRRAVLSQIENLVTLIGFVRRQIAFYRLPVRDILARCDGELLEYFGGKAEDMEALFVPTKWLDGEVAQIALSFAKTLGRGYLGEELEVCDRALDSLSALHAKKSKEEAARRKTEGTLSFGAAVLAIILLV